ncbi:UDP-3-O-(3-hydroxymyristoyl)glucosamine N-acyltransferase [Ectothiorhodospira marina]|uniref:UDP-3-O-acylglucosamine N-acyltransferase n=1 Tax=Ectothiorhodospira marina TaxID=1396821 RepID=A0A1H7KRA4_9GAMM|nr:UDP-3-O-(3-hydroxymyristoyl)glucosamine N-acyltransferase [Ectothiorhodospira marina]SEK88585.1 UDP-3-O-[3-hydroxymyristoyl] glucosamine N-acyltransferase [Ectothiorhodospira marina]
MTGTVITLADLAEFLQVELHGGDSRSPIESLAPLDRAGPRQLAFMAHDRYRDSLIDTQAGAVILSPAHLPHCPVPALVCEHPHVAYAQAARRIHPDPVAVPGIHPSASISDQAVVHPTAQVGPQCVVEADCQIGPGVIMGPGCFLQAGCQVGENSRLVARVTLGPRVRLGRRALVQPGAVIGGDGFGFARQGEAWLRVPQVGSVCIGDDVEVGANTTIDRGALDDTIIEDGVKLDNLIQVAHNVHIGAHTAVAGCVGIAGSARIGRRCGIGGGAGILGHLEIADDVTVTAMTLVTHSIREPGVYSSGVPQAPAREWNRSLAHLRRLGELFRRVRGLEQEGDPGARQRR